MTITDDSHQLRPEQFQLPFRSDTPRTPFLSHVPVRQTSTSAAMPSPALMVPSKQEHLHPQTLEDYEQAFDVFGDPASAMSGLPFMNYDFPGEHPDFTNYQIAASSQPPALLPALNYASQVPMASQPVYTDGQYNPPDFDRNCPRSFSTLSPDQLSNVCFPAGYQFPAQQQGFCTPGQIYQESPPRMEVAFGSLSPPHEPRSMETSVYPTPASQHLPYHDPPRRRIKQELAQAPPGERGERSEAGQDETNAEPYAKLIYRALMEKQGHTMALRDIYDWFKCNTEKASEKDGKGWQNSIRHNLSMNGAFQKVEQTVRDDSKKGNMWRLTEDAIHEGVKSTTRYRKDKSQPKNRKSSHNQPHHPPAAQRQAAGAKGGHAARRSANKHQQQQQQRRSVPVLLEYRLRTTPDARQYPEVDPSAPGSYMLKPIAEDYHPPYMFPGALPDGADYMRQHSQLPHHPHHFQQPQHSEPGSTALSPVDLTAYHSFPHSPAQDQSWVYRTISDAPGLFSSPPECCTNAPGNRSFEDLLSNSPSLSDGDDPPTPTHNPGGLDVDLDGYLAPAAPLHFFEAEGATV